MGDTPPRNGPRDGDLRALTHGALILQGGLRSGHGLSPNIKDTQQPVGATSFHKISKFS